MDLADIKELETVVLRLAARGPSGVRAPHCWFCGKIEPWFWCDCPEARAAQQGKRARPRFDDDRGVMILDEEIIRRNVDWGFARRCGPAQTVHAAPTVDNSVDSVDSLSGAAVDKLAARRAYKAEHERQRRARQSAQTEQ